MATPMTFNEFKTKVKSLLLYDQDSDDPQVVSYIDALIVEWMYEAMFYVDNYRVGNTDTFLPADVDVECVGGRVDLPAELYKLESVAIVKKSEGEDSYIISGAGNTTLNGEYSFDGSMSTGDDYQAFSMLDELGAYVGSIWLNTSKNNDWQISTGVPFENASIVYTAFNQVSPTPPLSGWDSIRPGDIPAPTLLFVEDDSSCETVIDLDPVAWDQRDEILNGQHCNKYAIDSRATEIYFRPIPEDNEETGETQWLRVEWEGQKTDYSGQETVPYGFDAAKNCADFINMNLAIKKNDKPAKATRFEKMFDRGMQRLFKTQRAKSQQG